MIMELDFDRKEIIVKDDVAIGEVIKQLESIRLTNWKEWKIKATIKETIWQYWPYQPYYAPIPNYPILPVYEPYKITYSY